ncbi:hypothetical protein GW796_08590 [archaeon]|nr:hypothetical protein [archaeon]
MPFDNVTESTNWINSIKKDLSFKWNMNFHHINISLNYGTSINEENQNHLFSQWSNILGLSENEFKELFSISFQLKPSNFLLTATLIVSTDSSCKEEHIDFCNDIKKIYKSFFMINQITSKKLSSYFINSEDTLFKLDETSTFDISKFIDSSDNNNNMNWIYGLSYIFQKELPINIHIDIDISNNNTTMQIVLKKNDIEKQNILLTWLLNSLNKENYSMLNFDSQIKVDKQNSPMVLPLKSGIPFFNKTDENIVYWNSGFNNMQTSSNTLIFSFPGGGKSTLLNLGTLNSILNNKDNLPYVSTIDIGPSSNGIIDFLKNTVHPKDAHKIQYHNIKMSPEYIVNPFDTELGCRTPCSFHNSFLINLISILCHNSDEQPQGLTGFINQIIYNMYQKTSEKGTPKLYDKGVNKDVDKALEGLNFTIENKTSWWEVVDILFLHGNINLATIAQRYAVPLLSDAIASSQDDKFKDIW